MVIENDRHKYFIQFKSRLKNKIQSNSPPNDIQIGSTKDEIITYLNRYNLPIKIHYFNQNKNLEDLYYIFWWGTCLADIAYLKKHINDKRLLLESGHFNLAVSLFDTLFDENSIIEKKLLSNLRTESMLISIQNLQLNSRIPKESLITLTLEIISDFLNALYKISALNIDHNKELNQLLKKMYLSEIGVTNNCSEAKQLPIYFIGAMCIDFNNNEPMKFLFLKLSKLLSCWDDWIDIREDLRKNTPNQFLFKNGLLRYIQRLFVNNYIYHFIIYKKHAKYLKDILDILDRLDVLTKSKTMKFLNYLICEKPVIF